MAPPKGHAPYNVNGEGGRPPKYSDEEINGFADEFLLWLKNEDNFWIKDFCLEKGINPDKMQDWAKVNDRFRRTYEVARKLQESRLLKGGLVKGYNSGLAKFALNVNHGWIEKSEQKINSTNTNTNHSWVYEVSGTTADLVCEEKGNAYGTSQDSESASMPQMEN